MRRIRNNPQVVLTPNTLRGKPRDESVEGTARIIDDAPERAESAKDLSELLLDIHDAIGDHSGYEFLP
jgi:hypothetical protein